MSRRIRPSARKKTWHNVMCSALSETDKKCIEEVFETFEHLKAEKEALIAGQETLQKALAEKIEESENQSQNFKVLISDHRTLQQSFDNLKGLYEAEKAKVEKAKEKSIYFAKELQTAKAELKETTEKFNCQQTVYADLSDIIRDKNAEIERLQSYKTLYENLKAEYLETISCIKTAKVIDETYEEMVGDAE